MSAKRKPLANGEKAACIKAGLTIPNKHLFDSKGVDNTQLRKDAQAEGAVHDSKLGVWVFPDSETLVKYQKRLGLGVMVPAPANYVEVALATPGVAAATIVAEVNKVIDVKPNVPVVTTPPPRAATSLPEPKVEEREREFAVDGLPGGESFPSSPATVEPPKQEIPVKVQAAIAGKNILPLRPSILVVYSVSLDADVTYKHLDEQTEVTQDEDDGTRDVKRTATVETEVRNEEEHQAAKALRSQMYGMLRKLGSTITGSALLVDVDREVELDAAIIEVEKLAFEHNTKARNHFLRPVVTPCAVLGTKAEKVAKQAAFDLQEMLGKMQKALDDQNEERITQLASQLKVKALALEPGVAQGALKATITEVRAIAKVIRDVAKNVKDKSEQIAKVKEQLRAKRLTTTVDSARMMFLDFEIPAELAQARASANAARFEALETQVPATELPPPAKVANGNRFDF